MVGDSVAAGGGRRPGRFLPAVALGRWALWRLPRRGPGPYPAAIGVLARAAPRPGAFRTATGAGPLGEVLAAGPVLRLTVAGVVFRGVNAALVTAADGPRRPREVGSGHAFDAAMTASALPLAWAVEAAPLLVPLL